ncbi:MAG: glycosyltransferase family 2 protein [Candidatus Latescibacteria bacterium]|jgi:glycosyltransferase involved in cell wall biosynthesis|nr:glycosyltransferase family 2 protein [Candidatus Latescibacterota bacterium]
MIDLSVIIPVYNEEKTLRDIVDRVQAVVIPRNSVMEQEEETNNTDLIVLEIVLVDDGSADSTPDIIENLKAHEKITNHFAGFTILRQKNAGKGAALKTGIAAAQGDMVLFQDADLEYDPQDYSVMIKPIMNGEVEAVIGSRFLIDQNLFISKWNLAYLRNHLGIRLITLLTNVLYRFNATDYEGCYKAFKTSLIKSIPLEANGFEIDNELLCKIFRRGHPVREVPIHYYPRSYNEGKKIKFRDGMIILWTIIRWRVKAI